MRRVLLLDRLQLPVKQVSRLDEDEPGGAYFEVTEEDGSSTIHRPRLYESHGRRSARGNAPVSAAGPTPSTRGACGHLMMFGGGAPTAPFARSLMSGSVIGMLNISERPSVVPTRSGYLAG